MSDLRQAFETLDLRLQARNRMRAAQRDALRAATVHEAKQQQINKEIACQIIPFHPPATDPFTDQLQQNADMASTKVADARRIRSSLKACHQYKDRARSRVQSSSERHDYDRRPLTSKEHAEKFPPLIDKTLPSRSRSSHARSSQQPAEARVYRTVYYVADDNSDADDTSSRRSQKQSTQKPPDMLDDCDYEEEDQCSDKADSQIAEEAECRSDESNELLDNDEDSPQDDSYYTQSEEEQPSHDESFSDDAQEDYMSEYDDNQDDASDYDDEPDDEDQHSVNEQED